MSELDVAGLEQVRSWAQARLESHEKRLRLAPLMEAMQKQIQLMQTQVVPNLLAEPKARTREAVLSLEQSLAELPVKIAEAERLQEDSLRSARARTAALRRWREALD